MLLAFPFEDMEDPVGSYKGHRQRWHHNGFQVDGAFEHPFDAYNHGVAVEAPGFFGEEQRQVGGDVRQYVVLPQMAEIL